MRDQGWKDGLAPVYLRIVTGALMTIGVLASPQASARQASAELQREEKIRNLFGMERETFDRELRARFQYDPPPPPAVMEDRADGFRRDARYFEAFPDYDRSFTEAMRDIARTRTVRLSHVAPELSREAFVLAVAEIAALAGNGHTTIDENAFAKNTPRLPLRTFAFADGVHVLRADAAHLDLVGAEILAIEGRAPEDMFARLARYVPGPEARRRLLLLPVLESPGLLAAAGLASSGSQLTLSLRLPDGRIIERVVEAEERGPAAPVMSTIRLLFPAPAGGRFRGFTFEGVDIPVYLRERTRLFGTATLEKDGLYIRLSANADGDEESLSDFLAAAVAEVREQEPAYVVVDLRMNGGGDYTRTYDFARILPEAAGEAPIYVVTSPWTFSAAITTLAVLKEAGGPRIAIVGEPSGDGLDFWAEGGSFQLPNVDIRVHYAAGRHDYTGGCKDRTQCFWLNELYPVAVKDISVDLPAPLTFTDWRDGRDPAIAAILADQARQQARR